MHQSLKILSPLKLLFFFLYSIKASLSSVFFVVLRSDRQHIFFFFQTSYQTAP